MKTATQELTEEHDGILLSLDVIEKMAKLAKDNKNLEFNDVESILEFLQVFADKCHHGKEEGLLFPALEKLGIGNENGPIGVMLSEHVEGRGFIKDMVNSTANKTLDKNKFAVAATSYVNLMRTHIRKENQILFPMGEQNLSDAEQKELLEAFDNHERTMIGEGKHEEFHKMLDRFEAKYLK